MITCAHDVITVITYSLKVTARRETFVQENPTSTPVFFVSTFLSQLSIIFTGLVKVTELSGRIYPTLTKILISFAGYEGEACEDDKVVPSAPPMDLMDHFTGYEQLSFEAGKYTDFVFCYLLIK